MLQGSSIGLPPSLNQGSLIPQLQQPHDQIEESKSSRPCQLPVDLLELPCKPSSHSLIPESNWNTLQLTPDHSMIAIHIAF